MLKIHQKKLIIFHSLKLNKQRLKIIINNIGININDGRVWALPLQCQTYLLMRLYQFNGILKHIHAPNILTHDIVPALLSVNLNGSILYE